MNWKRIERRFLAKVRKTETCWYWTGAAPIKGSYGAMRVGDKTMKAHRLSYELYKGAILPGFHVLHRCDVPACCNPDHLFLGTHRDNMQDKMRKGRHYTGVIEPGILSEAQLERWSNSTTEQREAHRLAVKEALKKLPPDLLSSILHDRWVAFSVEQREEIKQKIAAALKGKPFTETHLDALRNAQSKWRGQAARYIPPRKLTDDQLTIIAARYAQGETSDALANEFHVSGRAILTWMKRKGIKRTAGYGTGKSSGSHGNKGRSHPGRAYTPEEIERYREMRRQWWAKREGTC